MVDRPVMAWAALFLQVGWGSEHLLESMPLTDGLQWCEENLYCLHVLMSKRGIEVHNADNAKAACGKAAQYDKVLRFVGN